MLRILFPAVISLNLLGCSGPFASQAGATRGEVRAQTTSQAIQNEVALSRLVGYVRYFHPSDQATKIDWQQFLAHGFHAVANVPPGPKLASKLEEIIRPIAPTVRVFPVGQAPALPPELALTPRPTGTQLVCWRRIGYGEGALANNVYSAERLYFPVNGLSITPGVPLPHKPHEADLGAGVACRVPQTLYVDAQGTLPRVTASAPWSSYRPTAEERRLAIAASLWNVPRHFYPYFDVVGTDWLAELPEVLRAAHMAQDEAEFYRALQRMAAQLKDGHAGVTWSQDDRHFAPPLRLDWAEGKVVVSAVDPTADLGFGNTLERGEVVTTMDGQPIQQRLADEESLYSGATPQWIRNLALTSLLCGRRGSTVTLGLTGRQGSRILRLSRSQPIIGSSRPSRITEVTPGVFHLNTGDATDRDFEDALPKLQRARGLIIDLRDGSYPDASRLNFWKTVMPRLIAQPISSIQFHLPVYLYPDQTQAAFMQSDWSINPQGPRIPAKLAFLCDRGSISQMELWLDIAKHYRLGELIGEPTAGTDGNIDLADFGEFRLSWTGMKVLKHDGSRSHGIAITPTIPVRQTIEGIRTGRDEILEKAIAVVNH